MQLLSPGNEKTSDKHKSNIKNKNQREKKKIPNRKFITAKMGQSILMEWSCLLLDASV